MALQEALTSDVKEALKAKDQSRVETLRLLQSVLQNKAIEKRGKGGESALTDEEVLAALTTEAKKRKESIRIFEEGGRQDLAEKEKKELAIIETYLPQLMSREETEKAVNDILAKYPSDNFGAAMKAVMAELKGKADAQVVSQIVKQKMNG